LKKALRILAIALTLSIIVVPAQAQRRTVRYLANYENEPYHFGFLLAYNQMMYTIKTVNGYQNNPISPSEWPNANGQYDPATAQNLYVYNIETQQTPGFTVGIIGSKRLGRYFDLRFIPSLSFSERRLNYDILVEDNTGTTAMRYITKPIFTTFVEFPLNIKYRSKRYNNIGAYLLGGINPKLDLASQKHNKETNANGEEFINNLVTKRFDFAAEIGVGFDIYNQWFRMGVELKMSYGVLDIVKGDAFLYTKPIDQLRNKMFQLSFLFE
jgi:hypothetical protein